MTAKMPTDFPSWYATVEAGPTKKADLRWKGICGSLEDATDDDVESLMRMALRTRHEPDADALEKFVAQIRAADEAFDSKAAEREIAILAASSLVARLEFSPTAALALTTADSDGARRANLPMDLSGLAENAVSRFAASTRARIDPASLPLPRIAWTIAADKVSEKTPEALAAELKTATEAALHRSTTALNTALSKMGRRQALADEELQMLWWLTSNQLTDGRAIDSLKGPERPLTVGLEIADRSVALPGPRAVAAILSRAGLVRKSSIKVIDAVNAMSDQWCKSTLDGLQISPLVHPIHEAIKRREETGVGSDWIKPWARWCEVAEDHSLVPLRLSELFYRERLLLTLS